MSHSRANARPYVVVGRWVNTYLAPARHPSPEDLRRRLDQCVNGHLAGVCGASLAGLLDAGDSSVWRIRELKMNFSVEASLRAEAVVAKAWGENLASQIVAILGRGQESDSILRFENRAAYLAHFLLDLAAGQAWTKWYYEEFDSLSSLSLSQAIAAALAGEPEEAMPVILKLASRQGLGELLRAVTDADAGKIYQACFSGASPGGSSDEGTWVGRILELWNESPLCATSETPGRFWDALRLLARIGTRFPGSERSPAMKNALDGLLELRQALMAVRSPAALNRIVSAIARHDLSAAIDLALCAGAFQPRAGLDFLERTMAGDPDWAMQAVGVVLSDRFQNASAAAKTVPDDETILTSYGSIFLLGSSFIDLDVNGIIGDAMGKVDETGSVAAFLRKVIAVQCLGRARAGDAASDAALRFFSGFRGVSFPGALQGLGADRLNLEQARLTLVKHLAAKHRCEGRCLLAEKVSIPSSPIEVLLVRDLMDNQWLSLTEMPVGENDHEACLEKSLAVISAGTGNKADLLLLGGGLAALAQSDVLSRRAARVQPMDSSGTFSWQSLATELGVRQDQLSRVARPAATDLAYFSLAGLWPEVRMDVDVDLAMSLVARAVLRNFAGKLIGFESSSPEHLYQNFLSGVSTMRISSERIDVQLPLCPLSVLLRISGVWQQTYSLPWQDGKEICLQPPAE